jgi:hypothetical protein
MGYQPGPDDQLLASRVVEVFPELRRRCAAHDFSSVRLTNADFIAKADFYLGRM